ncbi:glutamate--tRNA ligase [Propionicimonas sp.]|uniref:glutamate--tRNA ligase n=1 Tax=Propionicimonas sp. TaxID=1955623 RepID=UPI001805D75C|nr:glutamate--tRNA ligase [Propionicimonas sp.]MBU3977688.1 glutamate--tRNA ligase [Actinomycetota bacterium]MBA3021612.1 glutamate--tRNA ligase [Propionicimonas sp.]MBU3987162.1 glutamate--tRNA ligase [Actinomycetota bacterium]MBU4008983.1 glutamate--tRNA ligase [Actinomycetota bacterium]MBU4065867.1 glutamate--tRNA ligase [Actinomycetota bacterium]
MTSAPARLRVAPSPTGDPHVGTAYMSLFNLAYAKATGGQFLLRIEDTDRARYVASSEQQIYDTLHWLGLDWDEGPDIGGPFAPYRQSERLATYRPFVDRLIDAGHAYYCWCSTQRLGELRAEQQASKASVTGYDRLCYGKTREERAALPGFSETPVVRMLIPDDVELRFTDLIRGEVNAPLPDDQVILKADGFPTYHLAVVVDDHLMGITHVVRGEEWISSTPKHLLLYKWLGLAAPAFAHMPLLRNTDKSKISKRKNPAARLTWFAEQGYLPAALRNFLQLLAYPPLHEGSDVASFAEFVAAFDWAKVNTTGPIFDLTKLNSLNADYIRALSASELADQVIAYATRYGQWDDPSEAEVALLRAAIPLVQERLILLSDAVPKLAYLFTADADLVIDPDALAKAGPDAAQVVASARAALSGLGEWNHDTIQTALREALVDGMGIKPKFAFGPVRLAITGSNVSPPLFESMELLGRDSSLARLEKLASLL